MQRFKFSIKKNPDIYKNKNKAVELNTITDFKTNFSVQKQSKICFIFNKYVKFLKRLFYTILLQFNFI